MFRFSWSAVSKTTTYESVGRSGFLTLSNVFVIFFVLLAGVTVAASSVFATTIVALGTSQTRGKGVARGDDFPAQLETLLRAKGLNVNVVNAGKNGETTKHMAKRLKKVLTPDTVLVILQPGSNDARKGQGDRTEENVEKIQQKLKKRGIKTLVVPSSFIRSFPTGRDGLHLSAEGYRQLAVALLPRVLGLLGQN